MHAFWFRSERGPVRTSHTLPHTHKHTHESKYYSTYEGISGGGRPPAGRPGGGGALPPGRPGTEGAGRLVGAGGGPRVTGGGRAAFLPLLGEVCD
jgi:hypothetical protein